MPVTDPQLLAVCHARHELQTSRASMMFRAFDLHSKRLAVANTQRSGDAGDIAEAQQAVTRAEQDYNLARDDERLKKDALSSRIFEWIGPRNPEADLQRLSASYPIVLFPVRVETRFDLGGSPQHLLVRIYPDEIFVNVHERSLTLDEYKAGGDYYLDLPPGDVAVERERWRLLVARFGEERAAYIARVMKPDGDGGYGYTSGLCTQELRFRDLPRRPDVWSRPGEAVLPDRWYVTLYPFGGIPRTEWSSPVREPLALTIDPGARETDTEVIDGLTTEKDLAWTIDFDRALAAGMALKIPLLPGEGDPANPSHGFERLTVLGVKSSMPPLDTAQALEGLFDSHHYTRGMAFVPQGTPTNNTRDRPVPTPPPDRTAEISFDIERNPPPAHPDISFQLPSGPDDNFNVVALALGIPNGVFQNLRNREAVDRRIPRLMNHVLWPTTLGYFMEQLMNPIFDRTDIERTQSYFIKYVSGRGNYPTLRVDDVPYGLLPVLSLRRWAARTSDPEELLEAEMVPTLRRLRNIWKRAADAPRIAPPRPRFIGGPPPPPQSPLIQVLAQDASSRHMRVRSSQTLLATVQLLRILRQASIQIHVDTVEAGRRLMADIGQSDWDPDVLYTVFDDFDKNFNLPLVGPNPHEKPAYMHELGRSLTLQAIRDLDVTDKPLLFLLIRHALMLEHLRIARRELPSNPDLARLARELPIWNGDPSQPPTRTSFSVFGDSFAGGAETIGERVKNIAGVGISASINLLAEATTEELERLMTETLDVCSHRLDAWIGALAVRRLERMREGQSEDLRLKGSYFGAYALLHDVRPRPRPTRETEVGPAEVDATSGGFIHAPSPAHARTAAVLRSGHLAHKHEDPRKFAVDTSSERVRRASGLLDEVRDGVPLAAALGYRFERGVHDSAPAGQASPLEKYLVVLRQLYNLLANKSGDDPDPPDQVEVVAARNVVDGMALVRAHNGKEPYGPIPFGVNPGLPALGSPDHAALVVHLDRLNELFDAVSDLLTSESMYQLAQANVSAAQAASDALVNGAPPPPIEVARSRRTGVGVTHRVALVFQGGSAPSVGAGWPTALSPRAAAEPFIDGWLGQILGDPGRVVASVEFKVGSATRTRQVKLSDLGLRPLDVLALARPSPESTGGSTLERQLAAQAQAAEGGGSQFVVSYEGFTPAPPVSFPQLLTLARAAAALLGEARPLRALDLVTPAETEDVEEPASTAVELEQRVSGVPGPGGDRGARVRLTDAIAALAAANTTASRIAALKAAAVIAPALYPQVDIGPETIDREIEDAAEAGQLELDRRLARVTEIEQEPAVTATAARVERATRILRAIFGDDFPVLPGLGPAPGPDELAASLAARTDLLSGGADAPAQLLQQIARVRAGLGRWRKLTLMAGSLGARRPRLDVAQLPHVPGDSWAGGRFSEGPPAPGRISLLLLAPDGAAALNPTLPWRGLLLDDWVELIPSAEQSTGVAFHHDGPNAEAGNAILVAVPSGLDATWSFAELRAVLEETFDLVTLRAIDPDILGLGQLLPAIFLASNTEEQTPATNFQGSLANDLRVIEVD